MCLNDCHRRRQQLGTHTQAARGRSRHAPICSPPENVQKCAPVEATVDGACSGASGRQQAVVSGGGSWEVAAPLCLMHAYSDASTNCWGRRRQLQAPAHATQLCPPASGAPGMASAACYDIRNTAKSAGSRCKSPMSFLGALHGKWLWRTKLSASSDADSVSDHRTHSTKPTDTRHGHSAERGLSLPPAQPSATPGCLPIVAPAIGDQPRATAPPADSLPVALGLPRLCQHALGSDWPSTRKQAAAVGTWGGCRIGKDGPGALAVRPPAAAPPTIVPMLGTLQAAAGSAGGHGNHSGAAAANGRPEGHQGEWCMGVHPAAAAAMPCPSLHCRPHVRSISAAPVGSLALSVAFRACRTTCCTLSACCRLSRRRAAQHRRSATTTCLCG